jgi:hypothetical protein
VPSPLKITLNPIALYTNTVLAEERGRFSKGSFAVFICDNARNSSMAKQNQTFTP